MKNMFGDIVSDLMAGLVGGLGMAPAGNIGRGVAMFEAVRGSAPDIAGRGVANPTALMLAACAMLDHLGLRGTAARVRRAVRRVLDPRETVTRDLGGGASAREYAQAVIRALEWDRVREAAEKT